MAPGRHQTIANIIPPFSNSSSNVLLEGNLSFVISFNFVEAMNDLFLRQKSYMKERVRKNIGNRKKLKYNHRGGSLSFLSHHEKKRKAIGEQPNEIELEKMKEMEQEPVDEDGTPLSPKEIVELVVGKNFRGFGFRPTVPTSGSRTSSQVESEMQGIIDSQAKELESKRNELESTRIELGKTCDELKKCQIELTDTRAIVDKLQEHMKK
ncbi:hypothetical protein CICLE_v10006539mg [Citrus x clementina]|uniref:Uncharacterized protein n=1 Tax=Citrus clementina TaxID=85681 RepID=V4RK26_CITCL|nr:hypothetical protein CICLE_v10006539mg [Citrus x clementina]